MKLNLCVSIHRPLWNMSNGFLKILMKLKICPISHNTLTLYNRILSTLRDVTLSNGEI